MKLFIFYSIFNYLLSSANFLMYNKLLGEYCQNNYYISIFLKKQINRKKNLRNNNWKKLTQYYTFVSALFIF